MDFVHFSRFFHGRGAIFGCFLGVFVSSKDSRGAAQMDLMIYVLGAIRIVRVFKLGTFLLAFLSRCMEYILIPGCDANFADSPVDLVQFSAVLLVNRFACGLGAFSSPFLVGRQCSHLGALRV